MFDHRGRLEVLISELDTARSQLMEYEEVPYLLSTRIACEVEHVPTAQTAPNSGPLVLERLLRNGTQRDTAAIIGFPFPGLALALPLPSISFVELTCLLSLALPIAPHHHPFSLPLSLALPQIGA